jgi:phage recombination protein Bet
MASEAAVITSAPAVAPPVAGGLGREQIELLKTTVARGATDNELKLFVEVCRKTGLDPFIKQIHAVKRWDSDLNREVMAYQVGIDGFRLQAQRSGDYEGQTQPQWCDNAGKWFDVWTASQPPFASRVGVWRKGFREATYGIAYYSEYVQRKRDGAPTRMWKDRPVGQLAKCAESLALRKAFPAELSGLYTHEEMAQADNSPVDSSLESQLRASVEQAKAARGIDTGGHPVGTQAAADYVAESKITDAMLRQELAQYKRAATLTANQPKTNDFAILKAFGELKTKVGQQAYYIILANHGFKHANEIADRAQARAIYLEMEAYRKSLRQPEPAPDLGISEADVVEPKSETANAANIIDQAPDIWAEGRD